MSKRSWEMLAAFKEAIQRQTKASQTPVTKLELGHRYRQRLKPIHELHLTPDAETRQTVNTRLNKDNEARIKFIEERMQRVKCKVKREFGRRR